MRIANHTPNHIGIALQLVLTKVMARAMSMIFAWAVVKAGQIEQ